MPINPRLTMSPEQLFLIEQAMRELDARYDARAQMIWEDEGRRHGTRESAHYALGLLLRDEKGDAAVASSVIDRVLDMQLVQEHEIYDGTFNTSPERPRPPAGYTAWGTFPPGYGYANSEALDEVYRRFAAYSKLDQRLLPLFRQAVDEVYPRVWKSFDPNWREFIACTFALILEHFEKRLPEQQIQRIDRAMQRTVAASLERYLTQSIPTNTNIELMHLFIAHYFGHRYQRLDWMTHAERSAARLYADYMEFHSFAEFNSSTYYGVDLTVLGMWRQYSRTASFRSIGHELEHGLWEDIAEFYEPNLENLCGPFARSYENEITEHSSIGVLLYLALGPRYRHLAVVNCETSHDPMIALVGVDVPEQVCKYLVHSRGERMAYRQFKELCERDMPGRNRNVCTARAWISERLMIGGLSGSRNTNGQMHHATAHWLDDSNRRYSLRMLRREVGQTWNSHLRGISFHTETGVGELDITVKLHSDVPIELVFEIGGPELDDVTIASGCWRLPGLTVEVETEAPEPALVLAGSKAEIVYPVYLVHATDPARNELRFRLQFLAGCAR